MEIITNTTDFYLEKESAVAIGKFDGLHLGHRRLLDEIIACKKQGMLACVFTFNPAPAVLFGFSDGKELTTAEEKRRLFEDMGVDVLIEFPLSYETAAIPAEEFVTEILAKRMQLRFLAAGTDLSFGHKGAGNVALLTRMAPELGFTVKIIDKVKLNDREISSTLVRKTLEEGDMELVEKMLGMPYTFTGTVTGGNRIGRTIGFPTANIIPPESKLLPPKGVYESKTRVGNRLYYSISNVGCKPTVTTDSTNVLETYIYDFDEDIYGREIEVQLNRFTRPERKFATLDDLKAQLDNDILMGSKRFS